jgi:hypothetical protein
MTENERLQGCLEAFRPVLINYGVPAALYADGIGVCFANNKKSETWTVEERLAGKTLDKTQFGMIADELGTELIPAGSPQAKGGVLYRGYITGSSCVEDFPHSLNMGF